ncbi:hypothetical protein INR49_001842 [Caranx melampygus]|nr:hypothetical protein INR49_001842 [Caranx melampygus]
MLESLSILKPMATRVTMSGELTMTSIELTQEPDAHWVWMLQLEEGDLRDVALLVFANKQDLPRAMSVSDVTTALSLSGISQPRQENVVLFQQSP